MVLHSSQNHTILLDSTASRKLAVGLAGNQILTSRGERRNS